MPGVYRPYTLTDVLGAIQQQAQGDTDTSVSGVGTFAEADDQMTPLADSAAAALQPSFAAGWDDTNWSQFTWA